MPEPQSRAISVRRQENSRRLIATQPRDAKGHLIPRGDKGATPGPTTGEPAAGASSQADSGGGNTAPAGSPFRGRTFARHQRSSAWRATLSSPGNTPKA